MNTTRCFRKWLPLIALLPFAMVKANTSLYPEIHVNNFDEPVLYRAISDNGKWAVAEVRPNYDGGKVINLEDMSFETVTCRNIFDDYGRPLDVTDDGEIVVGTYGVEFSEQPAIWRRSTGEWEILRYDNKRFGGGHVVAVTPDGHWAVGRLTGRVNIFTEATALWDLTTGEIVETPNLPTPQLDTYNQLHNRFTAISPDGRYICAQITPGGSVLYDRETQSYYRPEGVLADGRKARLNVSGMSPGCRYIFGSASINGQPSYNYDTDQWMNYCIYDMTDGSVQLLRDADVSDLMIWGVADDGTLYAGSGGNGTPMRDFQVYAGGYWYPLDQVLYQAYGLDYYVETKLSNTGTPYAFSADGCTLASFTDPNRGEGWVMKVKEPFAEIVKKVDLLGAYEISPKNNSEMSHIGLVRIGFDRNINVEADANAVRLLDDNGDIVANSLSFTAQGNIITIVFRTRALEAGKTYTMIVPEKSVAMASAPSVKNKEMAFSYTGRESAPTAPDESAISKEYTLRCLDYNASMIKIPFGCEIKLADNASASLLRAEDEVEISKLLLSASGKELTVRAAAEIPLYRYSDYIVRVPEGVVTDPSGVSATANKAFSLLIHGNWEEVPTDGRVLMHEDFNSGLGNKFMFMEGDGLEPTSEMREWGFTADTTPWWVVRDSYETDDYAACSHSSYVNGGRADDWMVIRRLYLPDEKCRLQFDSQCYMPDMNDRLQVYVIPSDIIYNDITAAAISAFLQNRILIYDEVQDCGKNVNTMAGEWRHNDISLEEFAGKYVYIAFVNNNQNGSALFVDNVSVTHDTSLSMSLTTPASVVAQSEYKVGIKLYMNSEALEVSDVELKLLNDADEIVSVYNLPEGESFSHDNPMEVVFPDPLALRVGECNRFSVDVKAGEIATRFDREITSLLFQTTKRAVIEEYSGSQCGNCPDGIIIMDMMRKDFGNRVVPLAIRSYMYEELSPVNSDYSILLGLNALGAPSATVNRRYAGYPVSTGEGRIVTAVGNPENGLWYDFVVNELSLLADADLNAQCEVNLSQTGIDIPAEVKFAVSRRNTDYSLFAVLSEDEVVTQQANYRYEATDPFFGEWGAGGIYGRSNVRPYYCDDLVRTASDANLVGTLGVIPADVEAGKEYTETLHIDIPHYKVDLEKCNVTLMLVDNTTGFIENVVRVPVLAESATSLNADKEVEITKNGSIVEVTAPCDVDVCVYDAAGNLIAHGIGSALHLPAPEGMAIVRAVTSNSVITRKLI